MGDLAAVTKKFRVPLATLVLGVALTCIAYAAAVERERSQNALAEQRRAADATAAIFLALQIPVETALSLVAYLSASSNITADEFERFTRPLLERHQSLKTLQWVARVKHEDRAHFERDSGVVIRQPQPDGRLVRAPDRPEYFPLVYMAPQIPGIVGLDVTFEVSRRAMVDRALRRRASSLSPRFRLIEDPADVYSVAVSTPLNSAPHASRQQNGEPLGLGAAIFHPHEVLEKALSNLNIQGLRFALVDASSPTAEVLFEHPPSTTGGSSAQLTIDTANYTREFDYVDRQWQVLWAWEQKPSQRSIALLLGGVLFTLLAVGALVAKIMLSNLRSEMEHAQNMGNYRLLRRLGEGGMGTVYLAQHAFLRRPTAVKVIRPDPRGPSLFRRFELEAQYTSTLTHPNTISIYDYGQSSDGVFFYAMEYISGVTLRDLVKQCGPLPLGRVKHLMLQVSGSIAEAHARGILHRDIKPENVMVCERGDVPDFVKVLDFGLVKDASKKQSSDLSGPMELLGTPGYMAPEIISNPSAVSRRSDVYALGALSYYLVCGKRVFYSENKLELLSRVVTEDPTPPSKHLPNGLSEPWERFILQALSRNVDERPEDAASFRLTLLSLPIDDSWSEQHSHRWWKAVGVTLLHPQDATDATPSERADIAPARASERKGSLAHAAAKRPGPAKKDIG
jgi:serine/threonine protein kinase/CHASE1-domain containing sensor protein